MCFDHLCGLVTWPAGGWASGLSVQGRVSTLVCIFLKLYLPRTAPSSGRTRLEDDGSSSCVGHLLGYPLGDIPICFPYHSFTRGWSYVPVENSLSSSCPLFLFMQTGSWRLHRRASRIMCLSYSIAAPCFLVCTLHIFQFVTAIVYLVGVFSSVGLNRIVFSSSLYIAVDTVPSMYPLLSRLSRGCPGGVWLQCSTQEMVDLEFETSLGYIGCA